MSSTPREDNRVPALVAKSDTDNSTVIVEADPVTKRLKVNATITGGGTSGTQYTDGDSTVSHPVGTIPVFDKAGVIAAVSSLNPLPVSVTGGGDASAANQVTQTTRLTSIRDQQTDKSQFTKLTDGTDTALITALGEQNVLETNSTGIKSDTATIAAKDFATQTTLALIKAKTDNIDVALSTRTKPADAQHVIVDSGVTTGLTDTQLRATPVPISGTITANAGTNLNTSLLTLDATTATTNTEIGGLTEAAPASDTASSGLNGRLQRIAQRLTSIIALIPGSLGQKARATSFAVTLSTEDITALTPPATITGYATLAEQQTQTASLSVLDDWDESDRAKVNSIAGQAGVDGNSGNKSAATQRVVIATDQPQLTNALKIDGSAVTQPVSGTVSSAQSGTWNITSFPQIYNGATFESMTGAGARGTDVNIKAIGGNAVSTTIPISGTVTATPQRGSSTTSANVSTSTTVATLVASNASRIKATIYNDSTAGILYVKEGASASATSFDYALSVATATSPGGTLICDDYTGVLTGILSAGTGTARVGET